MRIIAIVDKVTGNDTVCEIWKETASFDESTPIIDIIKWAVGGKYHDPTRLKENLTITIDQSTIKKVIND